MLEKVNNKWTLISEYNDSSSSSVSILERLPRFLLGKSYANAAKELQNIVNKKRSSGDRNVDLHHHAFEVAKRYRGVDHRKLVTMVECIQILINLYRFDILTEVVNVPGYRPVGLHEFFRFMSDKNIPDEDKELVKKHSVLHAKYPQDGHDHKVAELFAKHGISLAGVVKPKSVEESCNDKKDILPKSGAGQEGTDEVRKTYIKQTPGQRVKKFNIFIK